MGQNDPHPNAMKTTILTPHSQAPIHRPTPSAARPAKEFGGRIGFWNYVDIQWSLSQETDRDEVLREAGFMIEHLGRFEGGFIARQYLSPRDIELPPELHRAIYEASMEAGCR